MKKSELNEVELEKVNGGYGTVDGSRDPYSNFCTRCGTTYKLENNSFINEKGTSVLKCPKCGYVKNDYR